MQRKLRKRFLITITISTLATVGILVGGTHSAPEPGMFPAQVQPDGQFAYVSNNGSQNVTVFQVNNNGGLQSVGTVPAGGGPQGITVGPGMQPNPFAITSQAVYVVNEMDNTINVYQINPGTGQLTPMGDPINTGGNPQAVAVDPNGQMAIVANMGSDSVSVYGINTVNGGLTPMQTVPAGQDPVAITVNPMNDTVYVANQGGNGSVSVYSMGDSGLTPMGTVNMPPNSGPPSSIDVLPTGNIAVSTNPTTNNLGVFLVTNPNPINPTGVIPVGAFPAGNGPTSIDIGPSGQAAVTLNQGNGKQGAGLLAIFQISQMGTVSLRGVAPAGNGPTGVALDPKGFAYVTNRMNNTVSSFAIMPSGIPMSLGATDAGQSPKSVALAFKR
jgi:6-phosphogluconolactonase (cycloisomerase 2 family)